jgi:hypothetical protein
MKRKYQLVLIIFIGFILSVTMFLILNKDNKQITLIGDSSLENITCENTNKDYVINNLSTSEFYHLLETNIKINNKHIENTLYHSKWVVISLGIDELSQNGNLRIYLYNLEKILKFIKNKTRAKIIILGLNSSNQKINDANIWLINITKKYDINYLDVKDMNFCQKIIANS